MGKFIEKTQCPGCAEQGRDNTGDNLQVWDNWVECFSCGYKGKNDMLINKRDSTNNISANRTFSPLIEEGEYKDLSGRGISKKVCEKFKYQVGSFTGFIGGDFVENESVHIANRCNKFGEIIEQKIRASGKRFTTRGDSKDPTLFGEHLYEPNAKLFVVVTEGEIDCLSIAEAQGAQYPVVAVFRGSSNAKKELAKKLDYLQGFKYVILAFDNDAAGQKATKECSELFEPGRVRVANLPDGKDINDLLMEGNKKQLKDILWNAAEIRPDDVIEVTDELIEEALVTPEEGISWPWETLTDLTYGIRPNTIYTIGAGSGVGKTEFLKDTILHLIREHGQKVGAIFLEQPPKETLNRIIGGSIGKRIHIPGVEYDKAEARKVGQDLKGVLSFYDHCGSKDLDSIINKIRYMVKAQGAKYIILDHLTALAAGMKDERKELDAAMSRLGGLVHELDITLFLVSHLAKPTDAPSYEEGRRVTATAFRGSQSIQYWSFYMIGLERNKVADDPCARLITTVRILKDRFAGEADGFSFKLRYNRDNGRLEETGTGV